MECNHLTSKSLAGTVLLAPGLFLLCGHLLCAGVRWLHLLAGPDSHGLGVLSSVMWASSIGEQQVLHVLAQTLWPALLVIVGGVLLRNESDCEA